MEKLAPGVIYPAHGPPITNPAATLRKFRDHRLDRLRRLRAARDEFPDADLDELVKVLYGGEIPPRMVKTAGSSIQVMLHHLDTVDGLF